MTSLDLLTIFGGIENQYLLEAQTLRSRTAPAHRLHWKRAIVMLAAVVALMTLLCGTAMAVSTDFREYVFDIFGFFFPPKTAAIVIDGTEEEIRYSSLGEVTDEVGLGFAIYTDYGNYSMTEENGIYCIRPTPSENSEDTASPDCELVIVHTDAPWETLCRETRMQMLESWESISEIERWDSPTPRLTFLVQNGSDGDSPIERHFFYPDGEAGSYHLTAYYCLEDSKEHGKNFDIMAANFTVLAEAEASAAEDQNDARMEIAKLAKDFAEAYFNRNTEALSPYLADDYGWDRKEVYPGEDEVTDILIKQITGSENADVGEKHTVSVEFRGMDQPDRFQYLTIELIKQVDGWKVAFYGLEG